MPYKRMPVWILTNDEGHILGVCERFKKACAMADELEASGEHSDIGVEAYDIIQGED